MRFFDVWLPLALFIADAMLIAVLELNGVRFIHG